MLGENDLTAISNLLGEGRRDGDDTSSREAELARAFFGGGQGGSSGTSAQRTAKEPVPPVGGTTTGPAHDPKAIWQDHEVPMEYAVEDDARDPRREPEYDILYKQDVMSEDVFLGMGDKTPGSQDCTHMVVKAVFPGAKMSDLDLDVTRERLKAASAKLRLNLYLPLPVDDAKGNAKWDAKKETLIVTLPILREY